jgi:hypothetical protein
VEVCLNVPVVDPVVTQLVTQQHRRGWLMKFRDLASCDHKRRFETESWDVSSNGRLAMRIHYPDERRSQSY